MVLTALSQNLSEEETKIFKVFNNTEVAYPMDIGIHKLFEEQVHKTPNNIALVYKNQQLTYAMLNEKANQLARKLQGVGIKPKDNNIVAIMMNNSIEMIIGILGIIKSGAAYLPIDPQYPNERIKFILSDSKAQLLLTQSQLLHKVQNSDNILLLDNSEQYLGDSSDVANQDSISDIAYVIYTSGSTGNPKGVIVEHGALINMCTWYIDYYNLKETDRTTKYAGFGFDASVWEIFPCLIVGAALYIIDEDIKLDMEQLNSYYENNKITISYLPTQICERFMQLDNRYLRYLLTGGDKLNLCVSTKYKVANNYGPTENTVVATSYIINGEYNNAAIGSPIYTGMPIPIGKPIYSTKIFILNEHNGLCTVGEAGELCISGASLARGYLNQPELTSEKFIENPFYRECENSCYKRMYRTGDLAKWLPNGNIEFLGRIDHQVKIRGYRIELGEIQYKLIAHPKINEAVVISKEDNNHNKYLCAYIVAKKNKYAEDGELSICELTDYLGTYLPKYMIPSYFVQMDSLPLTPNGKIDVNSLPEPDYNTIIKIDYEVPSNQFEAALADTWKEVLGISQLGINDSFFMLGGDSIKAIQICTKLQLLGLRLEVNNLLQYQTIKEAAKYIYNNKVHNNKLTATAIEAKELKIIQSILISQNISPDKIKDIYHLTPMQEGMLFHTIFEHNSVDWETNSYSVQLVIDLEGILDIDIFKYSINRVIAKHDILRTIFLSEKVEKPVQVVLKEKNLNIDFIDMSFCDNEPDSTINEYREIESKKSFNLSQDIPIRVVLLKLKEQTYSVICTIHHIIIDGWCLDIIIKDFINAYKARKEGIEAEGVQVQPYSKYIGWLQSKNKDEALSYWRKYLEGYQQKAVIPTLKNRQNTNSYLDAEKRLSIDKELYKSLIKLAQACGVTLNTIVQTLWGILLQKYNNTDDVVFGGVVSGRPAEIKGIEHMVGLFINTIPIRFVLREKEEYNKTFKTAAKEMQQKSIEASKFDYISLAEIQAVSDLKQNLIDNIIIFENYPINKCEINTAKAYKLGFEKKSIQVFDKTSYDFNLMIYPDEDLKIKISYNRNIYGESDINKVCQHMQQIAKAIINNPDIKLMEIQMLTNEELNQLLLEFNNTKHEYSNQKTIHQLFEEQAEKTPDNLALFYNNSCLTYKELNEKANQLARTLSSKGITHNSIVGLMVERSFDMIISLLAILKAGGACLPIDTEYPADRIDSMLKDCSPAILLTNSLKLNEISYNGVVINVQDSSLYQGSVNNLSNENNPEDLLYLIYTSGSTGKPKGVMIKHKNLVNLINFEVCQTNVDFRKKVLQFTTISFDVSYQEIFSTLLNGGQLFLINNEIYRNTEKLISFIEENQIDIVFLPTSYLKFISGKEYINKLPACIDHIITAGEQLIVSEALKNCMEKNKIDLHNHYGPSETHVVSTYTIKHDHVFESLPILPPIGKPISNTKLLIVDKFNQLVPVGIAGELCISGDCVGKGYLNRMELTGQKFINNPFSNPAINEYENTYKIMYRTGDLAKWLPDGNIEFLGRIDQQVKIRGYRIELGEIENVLLSHKEINEASVIAREDNGGSKYLCAYIVGKRGFSISELREYLKNELPAYMIPSSFMQLDKFPLTQNGKIDKSKLPQPDGKMVTGVEYEAPRNQVEEKISKLWVEILSNSKIGINDSFFDLGGHSLKATSLIAKIYREFNIDIPIRAIFDNPTIKGLAKYIRSISKTAYSAIQPAQACESYSHNNINISVYSASSAQKRIFTLQQLSIDSINYNMPMIFEVTGKLEILRLQKAFSKIISIHESLRTSFELREEGLVQKIHSEVDFKPEWLDIITDIEAAADKFIRSFDLTNAPLIRVGIGQINIPSNYQLDKHILFIDMHHIISDGVSVGILLDELKKAYEGNELSELKIQYKDFTYWHNQLFKGERIRKEEAYWLNKFKDEIPVLNMTTDFARPTIQSFEGSILNFEIDKYTTQRLRDIAQVTETTMYMLLLASINVLLYKYTAQENIVIGSPIAGRSHPELVNIIGMFVNTLPIRNHPAGCKSFREFLEAVKNTALEAYDNQDYQFEELVDKLNITRDFSRNPLFDVMFSLQNTSTQDLKLEGLDIKPIQIKSKVSKFDLAFIAEEKAETINIDLEYCTKLFNSSTVKRMLLHLMQILKTITINLDVTIEKIHIVTEEEKHQILFDFNNTTVRYPKEKSIIKLFEEQVKQTPDNIAVVFNNKQLTYKQLDQKSKQLANSLVNRGVRSEGIIAIMLKPSIEMIIGILGILKTGAAYLPIDYEYPKERIEYILTDSKAEILLTQGSLEIIHTIDSAACTIINLDDDSIYDDDSIFDDYSINASDSMSCLDNMRKNAYIIYTSGSTGQPKGVTIGHGALVNMCLWYIDYYKVTEADRCTKYAGFGFDASVWEIFPCLISGAALHVLDEKIRLDIESLNDYYEKNNITISFLPTQICEQFMSLDNKKLRYLITGGDKIKKYINTPYKVVNNYGPTENTVVATSFIIDNEYSNIPIGRPIANTHIYIVDKNNNLQPVGVPGELCISGSSLAKGYLNNDILTAEKFVSNPFTICFTGLIDSPDYYNSGYLRMYKTGDLARWLPDGNIEFLGRLDHQVKVRGYRIELGEIENVLMSHPKITEAAVLTKEDSAGSKYICAYIVSKVKLTVEDIKACLIEKLPNYMIPQSFIQIEGIPLTANGKIDKKALLNIKEQIKLGTEYIAPRNAIEEFIAIEICKILSVTKVGINDNLFNLGANSLDIMKLTQRIKNQYDIDYNTIFKYPYISQIAVKVKQKKLDIITSIKKAKVKYQNNDYSLTLINEMHNKEVSVDYYNYKKNFHKQYSYEDLSETKTYTNILLAGATGYLGIYLLKHILEASASKLTLIIRGSSLEEAEGRLIQKLGFYFDFDFYRKYKHRITLLNGDLSEENLGLSNEHYKQILTSVDCIINSAANVKHYGLYEEFYKSNVDITKKLLDICLTGNNKDYFHISTISVGSGHILNRQVQFFSEYQCDVNQMCDNYYVSTKLEAEKLVLAARDKGVSTTIFRMGNLVFDSATGKCQENINSNAFYQILKSLLKFGYFPNLKEKNIELTFIDKASKAVTLLYNRTALRNEVFHINNINTISYYDFIFLSRQSYKRLTLLETDSFLDFLAENYYDPELQNYIDTFLMHSGFIDPREQTSFIHASDKTNFILNKLGLKWGDITEVHIKRMLDYGYQIDFFE